MKYTCIFLLLLFVFGCKKDDTPTGGSNNPASVIMPLKIGNQWIGNETTYDTLGKIVSVTAVTTTILRDTTMAYEKWYIFHSSDDPRPISGYLTNRTNGLWGKEYPNQAGWIIAKYPAQIGDTFNNGDHTTEIGTVISTNTAVTVPSGTYSCYIYQGSLSTTGRIWGYNYFSLNKGFIKGERLTDLRGGSNYLSSKWELVTLILN